MGPGAPSVERVALRSWAEATLRRELGARAVVRVCARCGSDAHGRPVAVGVARPVEVSMAYTAGLVAVAWSWTGPVGIDVERDEEGRDLARWTRLEAALKARGRGLADDAPAIHHVAARDRPSSVELPAGRVPVPPGYVATVVGEGVSWRLGGPAAAGPGATR